MKTRILWLVITAGLLLIPSGTNACSVLYYVDAQTDKIYVVNSEDYWLDQEAYLQLEPASKKEFARLWYGWDNFAQGGINDQGLYFDAAVTPEQEHIKAYLHPKNNLGDKLLARCASVAEALAFLDRKKIALHNSHLMPGDQSGNAVVVEWVDGAQVLHRISDSKLLMTNYLLSDPAAGNHPCYRYQSIEDRITALEASEAEIDLLAIGNTFGAAVQPARAAEDGRMGGTLYTTFIDVTDGQFVLSYKLSNVDVVKLDLSEEFARGKRQTIRLGE